MLCLGSRRQRLDRNPFRDSERIRRIWLYLSTAGFLYFTPIIGVLLGEVIGHFANDALAKRYIRAHQGIFEPEVRLFMAYLAAFLMIVGLILIGQGLQHHLNIGVIIVGWGAQVCGLVILSVTTFAYAVDSYPTAPAETAG